MDKFAVVLGGKLQEADPTAIKEFGKWLAAKMKNLRETARKHEQVYL